MPKIYGHRGARGEIPENSMAGLVHLPQIGVQAVEIDVQNSSDGVTVVWHDHNLNPDMVRDAAGEWLTSDTTLVIETPYADLMAFDFGGLRDGSPKAEKFPKQTKINRVRITSLEDVCRWAEPLVDFTLNIEIKSYADRTDWGDSPAVLAQSVLSLVQQYNLIDRTIVSSFDWRVLSQIRNLEPDLKRGYLSYLDRPDPPMQPNIIDGSAWMDGLSLRDHGESLPQAIVDMGGAIWAPYFEDLTAHDLERAHNLGLTVNVWTVNSIEDMKRMASMGVDGVITDYPTLATTVLGPAGQNRKAP